VTRAGDDAVRLLPPLNCSATEVEAALALLATAVDEVGAERRSASAARRATARLTRAGAASVSPPSVPVS
jgi:hypothetical protein